MPGVSKGSRKDPANKIPKYSIHFREPTAQQLKDPLQDLPPELRRMEFPKLWRRAYSKEELLLVVDANDIKYNEASQGTDKQCQIAVNTFEGELHKNSEQPAMLSLVKALTAASNCPMGKRLTPIIMIDLLATKGSFKFQGCVQKIPEISKDMVDDGKMFRDLRLAGLREDGRSQTDINTCLGIAEAIRFFVASKAKLPRYILLDEAYLTFNDRFGWSVGHTKTGEKYLMKRRHVFDKSKVTPMAKSLSKRLVGLVHKLGGKNMATLVNGKAVEEAIKGAISINDPNVILGRHACFGADDVMYNTMKCFAQLIDTTQVAIPPNISDLLSKGNVSISCKNSLNSEAAKMSNVHNQAEILKKEKAVLEEELKVMPAGKKKDELVVKIADLDEQIEEAEEKAAEACKNIKDASPHNQAEILSGEKAVLEEELKDMPAGKKKDELKVKIADLDDEIEAAEAAAAWSSLHNRPEILKKEKAVAEEGLKDMTAGKKKDELVVKIADLVKEIEAAEKAAAEICKNIKDGMARAGLGLGTTRLDEGGYKKEQVHSDKAKKKMSESSRAPGINARKDEYEQLAKDLPDMLNEMLDLHVTKKPVPKKLLPLLPVVLLYIADLCIRAKETFTYIYKCRGIYTSVTEVRRFKSSFDLMIKSYKSEEPIYSQVGINSKQSFNTLGALKDTLEKSLEDIENSSMDTTKRKLENEGTNLTGRPQRKKTKSRPQLSCQTPPRAYL
ncbi:hypothetical protein TrCOL_g4458 [Triparma columacea]|uniref:Uncharacterized protein n=1 Tax=Triparma columacea TaxID=722753 RepID=A0A9W7FYY8_9STRA|nr:hypothetical protein TrCOL_g4458 [Triparma columacea]